MLIPFGIGVAFVIKHGNTLVNSHLYTAQHLRVDSVRVKAIRANQKIVYAFGNAGPVRTSLRLDDSSDTRQVVGDRFHVKGKVIPVWARADGKATIIRDPNEMDFPHGRIVWAVVKNIVALILPALAVWGFYRRYKRKVTERTSM
jgi:hypothetical protein